jgi:membrane protease YdiL (CAAX protease family)
MTTINDRGPSTRAGGVRGVIARHPLLSFFVLACSLSWLAWIPYILSQHGIGLLTIPFPELMGTAQFSGVLPGALLGPLGSAFLVTAITDGRPGLRRWIGRLWRWRVAWYWYVFALLGVPALVVASGLLFSGGSFRAPGGIVLLSLIPGLVLQLFSTGLSEEPGWRDFALPRLQGRFGPLRAAAILGPVWALWHMPLYLSDWGGFPHVPWTLPLAFAGFCITFNVIMAWVFNRTGESLPLAMLVHVSVNNTVSMLWAQIYPGVSAQTSMLGLLILSTAGAGVILIATRGRLGYRGPVGATVLPGTASATPGTPVPDAALVDSSDGRR